MTASIADEIIPCGAELFRLFREEVPEPGTPVAVLAGRGPKAMAGQLLAAELERNGYPCTVTLLCESGEHPENALCGASAAVDAVAGTHPCGIPERAVREASVLLSGFGGKVISLEVPSGMGSVPDENLSDDAVVRADATIAFGKPALSLLLPENGNYAGRISVARMAVSSSGYTYVDRECYERIIASVSVFRPVKFAHKGDNGHALLVCASTGMAGAAVLSAGGALRSGCGLVSVHLPKEERMAVHVACPSAIVSCDPSGCFSVLPSGMARYTAAGAGCGLGTAPVTAAALERLLECGIPLLLDADALNIIAGRPDLRRKIPPGTVLTPHLGEFSRLAGSWSGWKERLALAAGLAAELRSVVVLKGAHTMTVSPSGEMYFNSTGTPAMARGGSGDVLAGLVTGLLARGADPLSAAVVGVYRHGLAGERAEQMLGTDSVNSYDLIRFL